MIELMSDLPDGVVGLRFSGHVTRDEYRDVVRPAMERSLDGDGNIRMLVVIADDFDRFEGGALWEDLKFAGSGLTHLSKWERTALVADASWAHHAIALFGWMVPGDVKVFPLDELADATTWVAG